MPGKIRADTSRSMGIAKKADQNGLFTRLGKIVATSGRLIAENATPLPQHRAARNVKRPPRPPKIAPSKPVKRASFIGSEPYQPPRGVGLSAAASAWKGVGGPFASGSFGAQLQPTGGFDGGALTRRPNQAGIGGRPGVLPGPGDRGELDSQRAADPAWRTYDDALSGKGIHGSAGDHAADKAKLGKTPAPKADDLETMRLATESALLDGTWTPQERADIANAFETFRTRYTLGDESVKLLNNYGTVAEYRRRVAQEREKIDDAGQVAEEEPGFFSNYRGRLRGSNADGFGPGFIIDRDEEGWYYLADQVDIIRQVHATMASDPAAAAEMITKLAAWGAYGGQQEKYVPQNVVYDENGNPVIGRWSKDDRIAFAQFLSNVSVQQAGGQELAWDELLTEVAEQNQEIATTPGYGEGVGGDGGGSGWVNYGRRGGGGYGYGGGGGGGGGISYTPADQLKQLLNGIARARLGYALSDEDINAFVADYHTREAAFVNARIAGQDAMQLDPESAAAAWIESRFRDQMGAQAANNYVQMLAEFLLGGGMSAGAIGN